MQHLVVATREAVAQRNWYAALALALTLPDVAAKLEDRIQAVGARYTDWCGRYLEPIYTSEVGALHERHVFLPAADAYGLRNAVLHEGSDERTLGAGRVLEKYEFREPAARARGIVHRNQSGTRLQLQVDAFCEDLCVAVERWLDDVSSDTAIQARIGLMMRVSPGQTDDGQIVLR